MADEIELKLEVGDIDLELLCASEPFAGAPKIADQVSTYFDTADHDVASSGFSLRIRRTGDICIQTIKADAAGGAGLFARSEWERTVEDDLPILDYATPLPAVLGSKTDRIAPLFEVRVERGKWDVEEGGTTIELVFDRGEVVVEGRAAPISEIELELKLGDPAALFDLARKIDAVVPVRLGVVTKSERGYRLAGAPRSCEKAAPVVLPPEITAGDAFRRIVHACIRQYRLNEGLWLQGRDPRALHQARVALRRMRTAFSIFKPLLSDDAISLREDLRWLAGEFGKARDIDVLLDRAPAGEPRDRISSAREAAYNELFATLEVPRARLLMLDVAAWLSARRWNDADDRDAEAGRSAREFATETLTRLRKRIKRRGKKLARIDDVARHEVRKDAKKLRYASEFFAALFSRPREQRRHKRFVDALEGLQDSLGELNDLSAAPDLLARIGLEKEDEFVVLLGRGSCREDLLLAAERAHDELFDIKKFW